MAINLGSIDACVQDLIDLTEDYKQLEVTKHCIMFINAISYLLFLAQATHKNYTQKLEELTNLQSKCVKDISHQRYRLGVIKSTLKK